MPMKLKLDDKGQVVVTDGNPVYVHDDGKEAPFDVNAASDRITALNGEAMNHRKAKETAEAALKVFEGIDPEAARKAVDTVKNLDQGQLVTAGKVEEIKAAAKKAAEDQVAAASKASNERIAELEKRNSDLDTGWSSEKIGGAFSRSKFINDKIAVPPDLIQSMFGSKFKVDGGKIVGVGADGQPIYSRSRAGEIADFDEALESMVDSYSGRDAILKGSSKTGDGARPNDRTQGGGKSITRAAFDAMDPVSRSKAMSDGTKIND